MELQAALTEITSSLNEWNRHGLNEAQTSQVIVLRVLNALGYDIWNPFEVVPQEASNGSFPDYVVSVQNKRRFVVEVKKLGSTFDGKAQDQTVFYANSKGIRWALLTDGANWYLFDSFMRQAVSERLILHLSFDGQGVQLLTQYFERLFSKTVWEQKDPDTQLEKDARNIQEHIKLNAELQPVAQKLSEWMKENTIQSPEAALKLAYQTGFLDEESKVLIEKNKAAFLQFFTRPDATDSETVAAPDGLIDALVKGIELTKPPKHKSRSSGEFEAWLNGQSLRAVNWRDLRAGIAEAALLLGEDVMLQAQGSVYKTVDERLKASGEPYKPEDYRKLSNGQYLLLHASANKHYRHCRKLLKALDAPPGILEVLYKGERYHLP